MIRGETVLFGGQKELRKLARTFPGVYELLPNPGLVNTVVNQNGVPLDIFDIQNWQSTVTPDPNDPEDFDVEQAHLTAARGVLNALPNVVCRVRARWPHPCDLRHQAEFDPTHRDESDPRNDNWYDFDHAVMGDGDQVVPRGVRPAAGGSVGGGSRRRHLSVQLEVPRSLVACSASLLDELPSVHRHCFLRSSQGPSGTMEAGVPFNITRANNIRVF